MSQIDGREAAVLSCGVYVFCARCVTKDSAKCNRYVWCSTNSLLLLLLLAACSCVVAERVKTIGLMFDGGRDSGRDSGADEKMWERSGLCI